MPVHSVFTLHEKNIHKELSSILEIHYIELGKIPFKEQDIDALDELSPLEQFGLYLKYSGDPDKAGLMETLVRKGEEVITMADRVLRKISEEERLQIYREDVETAEMLDRLEKAWDMAEAREEGHAAAQRENAAKMKELGIPIKQIIAVTGLSENEITAL